MRQALVCGFGVVRQLSYGLLPLSFIFALHVLPVEEGFPTRPWYGNTTGKHINLGCILLIWIAVAVGSVALLYPRIAPAARKRCDIFLYWAWVVLGVVINLAPFAEMVCCSRFTYII